MIPKMKTINTIIAARQKSWGEILYGWRTNTLQDSPLTSHTAGGTHVTFIWFDLTIHSSLLGIMVNNKHDTRHEMGWQNHTTFQVPHNRGRLIIAIPKWNHEFHCRDKKRCGLFIQKIWLRVFKKLLCNIFLPCLYINPPPWISTWLSQTTTSQKSFS